MFSADFQDEFRRLLTLRRDVRHFRSDLPDEGDLSSAIASMALAPSVGLSEPWRLVRVASEAARRAARENFEAANAEALAGYSGADAARYAQLKLSGMHDAPVQIAVFCDEATPKGRGLGAGTMPEMRAYSCVAAVMHLWLALRAKGIGMGWVSILDPARLTRDLDMPQDWQLIGYFCIGYPETVDDTPELQRLGWEARAARLEVLER